MKNLVRWSIALMAIGMMACSGNGTGEKGDTTEGADSSVVHLDRTGLLDKISQLEKVALQSSGLLDTAVAADLLVTYQEFYTHFSTDTLCPKMLFRAADVARGLGKYRKCIELLTNLHDGYKEYEKRDEVAFLIAFTWDANMRDTTRAIRGYNQVIEMYPTSPWSEEAKNNIRLLQMTEAELLQYLKEVNS